MQAKSVFRHAVWAFLLFMAAVKIPCYAQQATPLAEAARPVDTLRLKIVEENVLTTRLVPGPAQHTSLVDYFTASNNELVYRFRHAREVYERGTPRPFRMITLVAGSAGVGKTFLKNEIFSRLF